MKRDSSRSAANDGSPESAERASLEALAEAVIGAAYEVSNVLGAGFLEMIYGRALMEEISLRGLRATAQAPFPVSYKARLWVRIRRIWSSRGVFSWKSNASNSSRTSIWAQCINYLKASGLHLALLINFRRSRVEWKRCRPRTVIRVHSRAFAV